MALSEMDTKVKPKTARPKQYVVLFHNDDFTPFDFVIAVLTQIFHTGVEEAEHLTHEIHTKGKGTKGPYTHEVAETRVAIAMDRARQHEFPFMCTVEPA